MNQPLVSILIPAYKPDFFQDCLDSALAQTYENYEVVVSDDCPTSAISDIMENYQNPRIRYIRNQLAHGPMFNYVESFKLAKGELIKFLNDDDLLHPECLEKLVPYLRKPQVMLATSYRQLIDEYGNSLPDRPFNVKLFDKTVCITGRSLAEVMLMHRLNLVGEPTCFLFRKKDVSNIKPHLMCYNGYGYENSGLGDVGLMLNLLTQGDCVYVGSGALSKVRVFEQQWQNHSGVRAWSIQSWKHFLRSAMKNGLLKGVSLGWYIQYYNETDVEQRLKQKRFMTFRLFLHQVARFLLPSR